MGLFARGPARPDHLPLVRPRLDGSGWPDEADAGRPSFEANTFYELAARNAYEAEAHALAEELVEAALPHVPTGAAPEDEPYLRKVFTVAARVGVGLGMVERGLGTPDTQRMDRRIAAALWQARRRQPAMPGHWDAAAAYFLLAGYYVARTEPAVIPVLVEDLVRGPD